MLCALAGVDGGAGRSTCVATAIVPAALGSDNLGSMADPPNFIIKSETEYRIGNPDGELHRAELTTAVKLLSVRDGHAVCESNGNRIFIASKPPPTRRRRHLRGR